MANGKKSTSFLLGRIYERTEALPTIQEDISEIKTKQINDFHEIRHLKKRVRKIESTSLSCLARKAGRLVINLLTRKLK